MRILYTAAHGGFAGEHVPLGGGAAVFEMLQEAMEVRAFTPASVTGREIIGFDTGSYARFSRSFERAASAFIREHDPAEAVVLVNDIAEGPDFKNLSNYRIATIWHVDVVAYIAAIYCRGWVRPETLTAMHRRLGRFYPEILRLIFEKQADCVRYSAAHIVPSPAMKEIILRCYPGAEEAKIHVIQWGAPPVLGRVNKRAAREALGIPENALVLLTLSRLSPEKNQQLLLRSLREWRGAGPVHVLLCGGAAYMHGVRHEALLRRLAGELRHVTVQFMGHVQGTEKQHCFSAADLYVFPSRHESYGLTLMEAFQYGLPALTLHHAGALAVMDPAFGAVATEATFAAELRRLVAGDLVAMGRAAEAYARARPFAMAAAQVEALLTRLQS